MHQAFFCSPAWKDTEGSVWAPRVPAAVEWLAVTLEIIAILDRKNAICLSRAVCHQWAFVLAIDRLLARTPGLMDAQQTDSALPASRPASTMGCQVWEAAARPSRLRSLTRMWMYPSVGPALSPIKKWAASLNGDSLVNKKWITVV